MTTINMEQPEKLLKIKAFFEKNIPQYELGVEDRGDAGWLLVGPYPTFLFIIDSKSQPDGFAISVNGDAPSLTSIFVKLLQEIPDLVHFGPYCEGMANGTIVFGDEAYQMKEQHVLREALEIHARRKQEQNPQGIIAPKEKKLIIPGQ